MVCSLSSLRFTDSVNAWDCSISLSKGTSDPILFPKNLLWECMYSKYTNTKTTLNTQRFLHQTTHCPSCHWCKVRRHAERDPPPAKKLFACWSDYWRQESILMMAGDTRVSCSQHDLLTSGLILCALHPRVTPQALIITNQILVVLATPCQIAGAS